MPFHRPVLVVGAGGLFGRYVAPELTARGAKVRGMVHHAAGEAVARETGVTDIAYIAELVASSEGA